MTDRLPYGIVFPTYPLRLGWLRFWTALLLEATTGARFPGRRLEPYFGVGPLPREGDRQRLIDDFTGGRLGGVLFAVNPYELAGTPLLEAAGPPRVAIMRAAGQAHVLEIDLPARAWLVRALDVCRSHGRERIAMISRPYHDGNPALDTLLEERGLQSSPTWIELTTQPRAAMDAAQRILHGPAPGPDALLITDDNLADYAIMGAERAGAQIPAGLLIVAHCNFPWPEAAAVPHLRLGFDAHEVIASGLALIDAAAAGAPVPRLTEVAVRLEQELPRSRSAS